MNQKFKTGQTVWTMINNRPASFVIARSEKTIIESLADDKEIVSAVSFRYWVQFTEHERLVIDENDYYSSKEELMHAIFGF